MLIRASAVAMLATLGSAASAQTTNCHWVGQTWTCDTGPGTTLDPSIILQAGRGVPSISDLVGDRQKNIAGQQEIDARKAAIVEHQRALAAAERQRALSEKVGGLAASGDCAGAQSAALDAGDFELANQVKSYCAK